LDQSRRASHRSRPEPEAIDLGNEPPLSVDGGPGGVIDRRRVSAHWFSGTILTGLCGAALMGGAVFTSLDGQTHFAALPERVESALRGALGSAGERLGIRKSDRLPPAGEANAARQVIRMSMTSRVGNREVVRARPFVRVASNLSLSVSELSAKIPPFNPQKMLSDSADATPEAGANAEPDAEVSFVTRDLAGMIARAKVASVLPIDDVLTSVREAANWNGRTGRPLTTASIAGNTQLAYAAPGGAAPTDHYAGFEARIVPENVTLLTKTASQVTGGNGWSERLITIKKGENIASVLRELQATPEEIKAIQTVLGARGRDNGLKEGHRLKILLSQIVGGNRQQPIRVIIANESTIEAVVALSDAAKYVSVDVASINTAVADASEDDEDDGRGVRLYQSIWETALRNQIPHAVVEDLIRIYSYDIDFQRKSQPGDSFEVLYAGEDETPGVETKNDVLYASLTTEGETKKYYRFQTLDDNITDYYDDTGKSAKKFLIRKPVNEAIMRSGFGVRKHPILGYMKMHTGVDWTAPTGTPIFAAGNGIIDKAGWESGYGKYIRIRHANGYETAYGHMTAFARGMEPGTRVRQGQIIGFVGSTGLSTGAHVHYEVLVNDRFVDPMRIKLPRGRSLEGPVLATFEQERDRIDTLMARNPSRVAQTK
jgi:murein DD-endopeptidase MepM/ murein hydrolase activator NlpD